MPVDTIVGDPERITTLREVEDVLSRILAYEQERKCHGGVLVTQNTQLGGLYRIKSEEEANQSLMKPVLNEPRTCEWGMKFYSRSYFEDLRKGLRSGRQRDYSRSLANFKS